VVRALGRARGGGGLRDFRAETPEHRIAAYRSKARSRRTPPAVILRLAIRRWRYGVSLLLQRHRQSVGGAADRSRRLAAVSTAGFFLRLDPAVVGRDGGGRAHRGGRAPPRRARPDAAARAAGGAVLYAVAAGLVVSSARPRGDGRSLPPDDVPPEVARLGHRYLSTWLLGGRGVRFFAIEATFRAAGTPAPGFCCSRFRSSSA